MHPENISCIFADALYDLMNDRSGIYSERTTKLDVSLQHRALRVQQDHWHASMN